MTFSRFADLDAAIHATKGAIPLSWVKSTDREDSRSAVANFGDALSPLVTTAISRLPCVHRNFDSACVRMVSVGTIGQAQRKGRLHFWGTGVDSKVNIVDRSQPRYIRPPETEFNVHAVRGPLSRATFQAEGIAVPEIYGDPAWFMPRILAPKVDQTHELGVIVHISELEARSLTAGLRGELKRYLGGESSGVRIISTFHHASWEGFTGKLAEILSCKRIVSTSFHGLIIPQAYGIPSLYFLPQPGGGVTIDDIRNYQGRVDHRIADFYAGTGATAIKAYAQPYDQPTDWAGVMAYVDQVWEPPAVPVEAFLGAFPVVAQRGLADPDWSLDQTLIRQIPW
jgi:hypothetical protein